MGKAKEVMNTELADNSLTCDSEGNCMLKDNLRNGYPQFFLADNALTCDSEGNCMLKDKLFKMPKISASGSYGGISGSFSTADNALTCDSEGNCMLKDKLMTEGKAADKGNFYNGEGTVYNF